MAVTGPSGSGKTTYLRHLIEKRAKSKVFVVNGDSKDFEGLEVTFTSLLSIAQDISNAFVLVDDIFTLKKKEHEKLRSLLSFSKRHKNVDIGAATHSFNYSGLLGVMAQFDMVVFTSSQTNLKDFNLFLKPALASFVGNQR